MIRRLVRPRAWRGFAHLRTRLAVLFAGLFAAAMLMVAIVGQVLIVRHARASVRTELAASGSVFDRLWTLRARSLVNTADVMARDFGFRAAVASGDRATIRSALDNMRARAGVPYAFVVTGDGGIVGNGDATLGRDVAALPGAFAGGRHDAVVTSGDRAYRMVVSPILAPDEIGRVVFALRLDETEMTALQGLSAIPLTATIIRQGADGSWDALTGRLTATRAALGAFMASDRDRAKPSLLTLRDGHAVALARVLPAPAGRSRVVLLLSYPLSRALAPYHSLQYGIILAGLLGMVLVLFGGRRLAGTIAQPIATLDDAARALGEGTRTEVEVRGRDEVSRLAASFNRMSSDILAREHQITHLAFHDALTGLPNRTSFRQQLDGALARASRTGEPLAMFCLDLDGFKAINDSHGHAAGDAVLRAVGERLTGVAPDAFVARLSGDEFALMLSDGFDPDRPRALAQAIVDALQAPLAIEGHALVASASIGIAVAPTDGADATTLRKNADLALLRAKQDGRGVFRFFEQALDAAARNRRQLELDLREALQKSQLRLDYQPIYDLRAEAICGFEALMRWSHPTRGAIPPSDFIPVAEQSGLIVALGEWALHEACREAMRWPGELRVAVNVSAIQFRNAGLASVVLQALARSGLPPRRLEIEITESIFLDGSAATFELLHGLRAIGVRIALDDFGTGYSSLSYLRNFPFDKIKIDRSFVIGIAEDPRSAAIVRAIVDLAGAFDMDITAEGVEEARQLAELRTQGCGSIQGFLFSRPLDAAAVARLLTERTPYARLSNAA